MKIANPKRHKWLIIINYIVFAIGVSLCFLVYMLEETKEYAVSALCVFVGVQGAIISVSICLCARMDKRWLFGETCVIEKNRFRKDKWIPYTSIQAIVICQAVDRHFYPLCDESGMPKSVIALFDNWNIARNYMRPDAVLILPAIPFDSALSCSFFAGDRLQMLMKKTTANVFISQKAFTDNKVKLDNILREDEERIFISVSNNKTQGGLALQPYHRMR